MDNLSIEEITERVLSEISYYINLAHAQGKIDGLTEAIEIRKKGKNESKTK